MDEMAQRRAVMILGVLSGQVTVTDAIESTGISRGTYYKLEERALKAMVRALLPGSDETSDTEALCAAKRIEELQGKIAQMEREKRRSERLESLVTKIVKAGPLTTERGRGKSSKSSSSSSSGSSDSTRTRGGVAGR
jgi:polyhydroxyalkanoate synthesis regulator phasin